VAKSTDATVNAIVEGQRQIGQMQVAYATAQAQAAQNSPLAGLTKVAEGLSGAYLKYEERQQEKAEAKAKQERLLAAEQAKADKAKADEEAEREFVVAADEVSNLTASYVRDQWNQGTLNYRSQAAATLARYKKLNPKQQAELVDRINSAALSRDEETRKSIDSETERIQNQQANNQRISLQLSLAPDIAQLKKLPPTEQAKPWLAQLEGKLDAFMSQNNGLSFSQKLEAVNSVSGEVLKAFEGKSDAYAEYVASMKARAEWAVGYQQLYGRFLQNRDESAFKDGLLQLTISTGKDYRQHMVMPGEAEANALKLGQTFASMQELQDKARERSGTSFEFSTSEVRLIGAGILLMPGFQQQLENNPILAKNPAIQGGIAFAKRLQQARTSLADIGIESAQAQEELSRFDLTNVNNFANVTRDIVTRQQRGQTLTPQQAYFRQVLEKANEQSGGALTEVVNTINSAPGGKLTQEQLAVVNTTLQQQRAAIANAQQAVKGTYAAKVQKFNTEFADVIGAFGGLLPNDEQLKQFFESGKTQLDNKFQQWKQQTEAAGTNALPPAYGATGNFNQVNQGVAAFGSPDGKVRVAPRTAAMVQTSNADGGAPWITPIQAGLSIRHSFNKGMMGGGYGAGRPGRKHAGIDFPLNQGQNAVSVVSGTVARVGTARGYGNYIDVMGDNGYVYRYAHVRALVPQGSRVQAGQAVASPNMSGTNVGGAHLHFEVLPGQGYQPGATYGFNKTVDPVAHLRSLTALAGQALAAPELRGQSVASVSRQMPWAKTTAPSLFTPAGGAVQAGLFQQVGKPVMNANRACTNQRPLTKGMQPSRTAGARIRNNPTDDHGYAWIRERPQFAQRLAQVADALGVPAVWIADIMRQESGENFKLARSVHAEGGNRNFGLFGFGSDSGVPNRTSLNEVQQLDAYYNYMRQNGWLKHLANSGGNVTLAQLWAMTRMGTGWRKEILQGRDPESLKLNDTGKTYADEIGLLGKWSGRQYEGGRRSQSSRSQRNRAVGRRASSAVEQALVANNTEVPYRISEV
jgi:murein DD-endopeptidase MepM/ murein hydrolase activator NlpD